MDRRWVRRVRTEIKLQGDVSAKGPAPELAHASGDGILEGAIPSEIPAFRDGLDVDAEQEPAALPRPEGGGVADARLEEMAGEHRGTEIYPAPRSGARGSPIFRGVIRPPPARRAGAVQAPRPRRGPPVLCVEVFGLTDAAGERHGRGRLRACRQRRRRRQRRRAGDRRVRGRCRRVPRRRRATESPPSGPTWTPVPPPP